MLRFKWISLLAGLLLTIAAGAQTRQLSEVAAHLQTDRISLRYACTVTQDTPVKLSGVLLIQGECYRAMGNGLEIYCDGATRWTVDPASKEVYVETAEGLEELLSWRDSLTELTLSEPIAERRELALRFGAKNVIAPMAENIRDTAERITGGRGFDVVFDCTGSTKAVYDLPFVTAKGGKLIYSAMYPNDFEMPLNLYKFCYYNELTITGMYVAPYAFPRAAQMLPELDLAPLTTKVFELEDAVAAFDAQVSGKYPKILIRCNKDLE